MPLKNEQGEQQIQTGYTALINITLHTTLVPAKAGGSDGSVLGITDEVESEDAVLLAQVDADADTETSPDVITEEADAESGLPEFETDENGWVKLLQNLHSQLKKK